MKLKSFILLVVSLLLIISCQDNISNHEETATLSDDQLIEAIQNATNKQVISVDLLPSSSKDVLAQDYSESTAEAAQMAPELGYEVNIRRERGTRIGEHSDVYFATDGRELRGDGRGGDRTGRDRHECFELVLPVTFIMPDGSTITVENENGYIAIRNWYAANPGVRDEPALQYPVDVVFDDGTTQTINNDEELRAAYAACDPGGRGEEDCFEFVYPISYTMPDGSTITGNSEEEIDLAIRNWYAANPGVRDEPALQYPVDVVFDDGTTQTINNDEELRAAYAACDPDRGRG